MRGFIQDIRYAVRLLLRSPGFTIVAALTLALGVGANTAIFSVVHGVLVKPLPYKDPDALLRVYEELPPDTPEFAVSPAMFLEYRANTRAFESLAAFERSDLQLGGERPERLRGMRVTAGFFALLGYEMLAGREFTRDDEAPGRQHVVILSHALWARRFESDRSIVGKAITLSGRAVEVAGVLPPGVQHVGGNYRAYPHGESVDVWWPRTLPTVPQRMDRNQHYLSVIGRMRPGVTAAQAQDDLRQISQRLGQQYPDSHAGWSMHVRPLRAEIIGASKITLVALLAAAGAVLFIACLNVAGLLLGPGDWTNARDGGAVGPRRDARAPARSADRREHPARHLGGTVGVIVAYAAVSALLVFAPSDTPRLHMVSVDRVVLAYALAATALTALLFGLAPAVQLVRADVAPSLRGGRGTAGSDQQRLRRALVGAEVALAFVLVVTGGLLLRSFSSLLRVDAGFRAEHVLTAAVNLPPARYKDEAAVTTFFDRLTSRVRALPGVGAAGMTSDLPWTGTTRTPASASSGASFREARGPKPGITF